MTSWKLRSRCNHEKPQTPYEPGEVADRSGRGGIGMSARPTNVKPKLRSVAQLRKLAREIDAIRAEDERPPEDKRTLCDAIQIEQQCGQLDRCIGPEDLLSRALAMLRFT